MTVELERLASACIFPGFSGTTAPDWLRRELALGLGGVVLFAWNVDHREQVRRLTDALHAERPDVVVAVDEEGGDVTRLDAVEGSPYPGNLALGAVDDVQLTGRVARAMAADLRAVGVDLDLAPVADVNTNPQNPIVGVRAFGSDPIWWLGMSPPSSRGSRPEAWPPVRSTSRVTGTQPRIRTSRSRP